MHFCYYPNLLRDSVSPVCRSFDQSQLILLLNVLDVIPDIQLFKNKLNGLVEDIPVYSLMLLCASSDIYLRDSHRYKQVAPCYLVNLLQYGVLDLIDEHLS